MTPDTRILYCDCAKARVLPALVKQEVRQALGESGVAYTAVLDLCALAAHKNPLLAELAGAPSLAIAACHPRAVRWLFAAGGAPLGDEAVQYFDLREESAAEFLSTLRTLVSPVATSGPVAFTFAAESAEGAAGAWKPWFPVIDLSRCQHCQQCLGFCLFGVYGLGPDGHVEVQNPASCKTGCPACARVCPDAAIIFPKYPKAPINGGEVREDGPAEPIQLDKAALVRGDVMNALKERTKNGGRFAPDPAQVRAVQERLAHLSEGQRGPDVMLGAMGALAAKPPAQPLAESGAPPAQLGAPPAELGALHAELGAPPAELGAPLAQLGAPPAQLGALQAEPPAGTEPA